MPNRNGDRKVDRLLEEKIVEKIEELRLKMAEEAFAQGSLTHEKVVALSQQLDKYIVFYQKRKEKLLSPANEHHLSLVIGY
jgi:hypothetical protein